MTKHKHADVLIAIANGEQVQVLNTYLHTPRWEECYGDCAISALLGNASVRIKPKTIMIGDVEVPEPMVKAPEIGSVYWEVSLYKSESQHKIWYGLESDVIALNNGICHATQEGAEITSTAIIKLPTNGKPVLE